MAHPVSMLLSLLAVIAADGMESSADPISASSSVASWFYSQEGSWTDRLGLRFRDGGCAKKRAKWDAQHMMIACD